ncbi:MAG: hypothetical protein OHK0038_25520 [Flammeovirgaceae bacterium]
MKENKNIIISKLTWGRYTGIIISGVLFLMLDAAILLFSVYISAQVKDNALRVNIAGRQAALVQNMTKLLLQIRDRMQTNETLEMPLIELKDNFLIFSKVLNGFEKGGLVPDGSGQPVKLSPCQTETEISLLQEAKYLWSPLVSKIQTIIANKEKTPIETVQDALEYALNNSRELSDKMNRLGYEIEKIEEDELNELRTIETIIIILALLNFLFLMAYSIKRLMDKDLQLENQRKEIKSSELKYRSIFESFPDIYARIDLLGNIQVLSPSALYHTGFSLQELVGQSFRNLFFEVKEYDEVIRLCQEKPVFSDFEVKIKQKKGGFKEMTITSRTFYIDGLPNLYEIVMHDISQEKENSKKLKALNDELSKANSSLKRALDLKKEFLAHASHDLKNPISAIGGVVKLMEMEGGLTDSQLENLAMIKSTTQYAVELLQQLVTDAMLDDENIKLTKTEFDLGLLVEEVVTLNKPNAERKEQKINLKINKGILLFADRHKLREAIDNFVSNAIKYSPFGKDIDVCLIDKGNFYRFEVKDRGPGLTEEDKRKVFGKFQRLSASPTADESSSGLGLSIVKRIIELHHGEVGVESEEGKGATFFFELPKEITN